MPVLQLDDKQFPLHAGVTRIGAGPGVDVVVPGDSSLGVQAVIDGGARPAIRRAADGSEVRLNGVLLGAEPTPLMHGDRLEIGGHALRFADDAKAGETQFVSAAEIAAIAGAKRTGAARATAASGGRLVSLVDGKEYTVPGTGLVFGRDAACDVVIADTEVSRRHAEIAPASQGYELRDTSANGVFVNGERVQGTHTLSRADVLRIGSEEFRFYADVLPTPAPQAASPAPAAASVAPSASASAATNGAAGVPVASPAPAAAAPASAKGSAPAATDARPVLATLVSVNEGPDKGLRHELRTPLVHLGRGAHNDVRLQDESVSETHAKLQRRDDGWYVVDMGSTNGTYVGGNRITGEKRIEGSPDVRFGGLKFRFTSIDTGSMADFAANKGTRAIARATVPAPAATAPADVQPAASAPAAPTSSATSAGGVPTWVWIVVVLVLAGVAFFVLKGHA